MEVCNGMMLFGFWENMPYGEPTDTFDEFKTYKNTIDKSLVIDHIKGLDYGLSSERSKDMFTGEEFNAGFFEDGRFRFPVDFLRYYERLDIGIPPEYEAYLKTILPAK